MTVTVAGPEARVFGGFELRDVEATDSLTMIRGRAVPYGEETNVGWFLESFAPHAFGKSIKEAARALPLLAFHNAATFPIGMAVEWKDRDTELEGTWRLDDSVDAQRAAKQAQEGFLTGLSVGFQPVRSRWVEAEDWNPELGPEFMDRVVRDEARLLEVSLVATPAYASAGVSLVRSADAKQRRTPKGTPVLDAIRARTEALRNAR